MQRFTFLPKTLLAGAVALFAAYHPATAQTLTADNPDTPTVIDSVTVGMDGVAGYDFFSAGGSGVDVESDPAYATVTKQAPGQFGFSGYSTLTIGGTATNTGVIYYQGNANTFAQTAAISLTSGVPSSFNLGFLDGNTNDPGNNAVYELELLNSGGTQVGPTLTVNSSPGATEDTNDFYFATITGAAAGDTVEVLSEGTEQSTLAGITFSSVVPEPSTYALSLAGIGALLVFARLRRA